MARSEEGGPPGKLLKKGGTAEVFAWEGTRVLKLYWTGIGLAAVRREEGNTRSALALGLPVPGIHGIVTLEGRHGLVFDRVRGPSWMDLLTPDPADVRASARGLADLHRMLHAREAPAELPRQSLVLETRIRACDGIVSAQRDRLLGILSAFPEERTLCHGDFHPGNLLQTEEGPVIIDWMDATAGWALADVARTSLLIRGHIETSPITPDVRRVMLEYHDVYLEGYFAPGAVPTQMAWWRPILAAARWCEGVAGQQDWLLREVSEGLAGI
jgi:aminoglycoside phosphotransferase (APT) family kinase protein